VKIAHVFDYDDTLSHSDYLIRVYPFHNGEPVEIHTLPGMKDAKFETVEYLPTCLKYSFTTREFVKISKAVDSNAIKVIDDLVPDDGHSVSFDFGDVVFVDENDSFPILKNTKLLENAASKGYDIWILTGRSPGTEDKMKDFVKKHTGVSIPLSRIICVGGTGDSTHKGKAQAFLTKIIPEGSYDQIHFYDDDDRNLEAVMDSASSFTNIHVINSVTDEVHNLAKSRVSRARELRKNSEDFRRIRQLAGNLSLSKEK